MSLELIGSRVLAPYFGTSIFVWGSLISVFLGALSAGYYLGGRLADRTPSYVSLAALIFIPGVIIFILPFFASPLNAFVSSLRIEARAGSLLSAVILFFAPGVFLGTVSPYAIKLQATSIARIGNTAGQLYAISTAGSIVGTLITSFFLIPQAGVRNIIHYQGLALVCLAILALVAGGGLAGRWKASSADSKDAGEAKALLRTFVIVGCAMLLALFFQPAAGEEGVVYQKDSLYHNIRITEQDGMRFLRFDNSWQSGMLIGDPIKLLFDYTRYFHLASIFCPEPRSAVFIGVGGGSSIKSFQFYYPELKIDAVDIDPEVFRVATRFFELQEGSGLAFYAEDGRGFITKRLGRYDLVVIDAYSSDSIPFHLATKEFLEALKSRLSQDGTVAFNIIGSLDGQHSVLFRSMLRTISEVFPEVYVFPVHGLDRSLATVRRNIIVIAVLDPKRLDISELRRRARALVDSGRAPGDILSLLDHLDPNVIPTSDVRTLTDDFAPVDTLMRMD